MIGVSDEDYVRIVDWMVKVMDTFSIDHRTEAPAYDNHSTYDYAFYGITQAAREYWAPRLGYMPTDESLFRAFFEAEKSRLVREQKQHQSGLIIRLINALRPASKKY